MPKILSNISEYDYRSLETRIENVKHCLKVMAEQEVCEECKLYGTTGTDHCEHDCVVEALNIIDKYQKIEQIMSERPIDMIRSNPTLNAIWKVINDGNDD